MSNQKISESALFKAILVFIALGALILGIRMFFHLPHFIGVSSHSHQDKIHGDSMIVTPGAKNLYIPQKEEVKRAPIHFDTHVKH